MSAVPFIAAGARTLLSKFTKHVGRTKRHLADRHAFVPRLSIKTEEVLRAINDLHN
jgi:hypothetical protein